MRLPLYKRGNDPKTACFGPIWTLTKKGCFGLFLDLQDHQKLISSHLTIGQNRDPDPDSWYRPFDGQIYVDSDMDLTQSGQLRLGGLT